MRIKLRWSAKLLKNSLARRDVARPVTSNLPYSDTAGTAQAAAGAGAKWSRLAAGAAPLALPVAWLLTLFFVTAGAQEHHGKEAAPAAPPTRAVARTPEALNLIVGKSMLLDSRLPMERVSVGLGGFAEVTAVGPKEVLVNGKAPGETTLIIWQEDGTKLYYDLAVRPSQFLTDTRVQLADRQIQDELPGQNIRLSLEGDTFFLRGRVKGPDQRGAGLLHCVHPGKSREPPVRGRAAAGSAGPAQSKIRERGP